MEEQSGLKLISEELEKDSEEGDCDVDDDDNLSDIPSPLDRPQSSILHSKTPKSNIVRGSTNHDAKSFPDCTTKLEHVSNITIRLNDLNE